MRNVGEGSSCRWSGAYFKRGGRGGRGRRGWAAIFRTRGAGLLITAIAIAARSKVAVLLPKKLAGRKEGKEDECNCSLHLDL